MADHQKLNIFVGIPHFFDVLGNEQNNFGSYDSENYWHRSSIVDLACTSMISALDALKAAYSITYYGVRDQFIKGIKAVNNISDPRHLPWLMIDDAYKHINEFDYFIFVEDDIFIPSGLLDSMLDLDLSLGLNEIVIPNRIESVGDLDFCVDMVAMPGWKSTGEFHGVQKLGEAVNIHSGFLMLSREKFAKAYESRLYLEPTRIIGDFMASALANLSSTFRVFRGIPTSSALVVLHLDSWSERQISKGLLTHDDLLVKIENARVMEQTI